MLAKPNSKPFVQPRFLASVATAHFVKAPLRWEYGDIPPRRTNEFSLSQYSSLEWCREARIAL
jgi:hypothetical protein